MTDYKDLVKRLRNRRIALQAGLSGEDFPLLREASDAIEELSIVVEGYRKRMWTGSDWIAVTERLPKLHEEVLVCNKDYGLSELGFAMVAVWDGTNWIETWNKIDAIHCITHWMPLPEPPKEET